MNLEEKTLSQEYKFKGNIINMRVDSVQIPDGNIATREVIEHRGGVCIVPLTDDNEIIYVKQFRYPYKEVVIEIPAGKRDGNEAPLDCGIRELKEETGYSAKEFIFLGELYPSPGYCGEIIYMYLAKGLVAGDTDPDDDEFLEISKMTVDEFTDKILCGEIKDAKTQTAVLKTAILLKNGKM